MQMAFWPDTKESVILNWKCIDNGETLEEALDLKIRETRQHLFSIRLINSLGELVQGTKIYAEHKNHDFTFGVCPNGHISMTNRLACGEGKEAESYWKYIGDLFNGTTLWWGWRVLEPFKGQITFDHEIEGFGPMERMVRRAEKLGHRLTAHALLYPRDDVSPQWLSQVSEEEALKAFEEHIKNTVLRYRERIDCWHPVNEAYEIIQKAGNLRINEGLAYRLVGDMAPHARIVNNGGHTIDPDFYEKGIGNAERFGGRVDDLGIRGYFELYDSEAIPFYRSIWEHFDNLTHRYKKGIRFTEIGAVSAPRKGAYSPWDVDHTTAKLLGIADFEEFRDTRCITEQTQAAFLVRMYKLAFAHPQVQECTYWDLCDSYTWNQVDGGLLRADLTPKPAYEALRSLIHNTWKTTKTLEADSEGKYTFEGFDGTYEVTVGRKKYDIHLNKTQPEQVICVC